MEHISSIENRILERFGNITDDSEVNMSNTLSMMTFFWKR